MVRNSVTLTLSAAVVFVVGSLIINFTALQASGQGSCWKHNGTCYERCTYRLDYNCSLMNGVCQVVDCTGFAYANQWCILQDPNNPGLYTDYCVHGDLICAMGGHDCPCDFQWPACGA